jgi:hypothetical protein
MQKYFKQFESLTAHITNDGRSISEEGTCRNPRGKEKPRTTNEKMERHTGLNRASAYRKRRRRRRGGRRRRRRTYSDNVVRIRDNR